MRTEGIEAFEYISARDPEKSTCVGLFSAHAFTHKNPKNMTHWLCETTATEVLFKQISSNTITSFKLDTFLVGDQFPFPS